MQDDLALIKRLQNKDERALSEVYDRYAGALYGVILRICKDKPKAQDLLQETFLKIWNKAYMFDPEKGKFFTWIYRIAKNTTLNSLRSPEKLIQKEDISVYKNIEEDLPKEYAELNGSLKKLETHHQKAVQLVYFEGLTHREAHAEMSVPLGTFKSYITQALKKLREVYQHELILIWICIEMIL